MCHVISPQLVQCPGTQNAENSNWNSRPQWIPSRNDRQGRKRSKRHIVAAAAAAPQMAARKTPSWENLHGTRRA